MEFNSDHAIIGFLCCALSNRTDISPYEWIKIAEDVILEADSDTLIDWSRIATGENDENTKTT